MFLETIAFFEKEIPIESDFRDWIARNEKDLKLNNEVSIVGVKDYDLTPVEIEKLKNTLFVVSTEAGVIAAKKAGAAVVGYNPKGYIHVDYVIEGFDEIDLDYLERVYRRFVGIAWDIAETKRCLIREIQMSDIDDLFELYSQPGVTDYLEPLYEYEKEVEYQSSYIRHMYGYFGYGMWLVFDKNNQKLIGRAGLEHRDYGDSTELEMGYVISPDYQRQGYATEVCDSILEYAETETDFERVNCLIDEDNIASIEFIKKMGFEFMEDSMASGKKMCRYVRNLI